MDPARPEPPRPADETVDREHQIQIALLDAFRDAVRENRAAEEIDEILARLLDYSRVHFLSEQLLMRLHAYPDHDRHVADHESMLRALESFAEGGRSDETVEGAERLRAFLLGHIDGRDRELAAHLAASGVPPAAG